MKRLLMVAAILACWSGGAFGQTGLTAKERAIAEQAEDHDELVKRIWLKPKKLVISPELRGGRIDLHVAGFIRLSWNYDEVEVRGLCVSACTLVTAYILDHKLCFAKNAQLAFHMPRKPPAGVVYSPGMDWTNWEPGFKRRKISVRLLSAEHPKMDR